MRPRLGGKWTKTTSFFDTLDEAGFPIRASEGATVACDDYAWLAPEGTPALDGACGRGCVVHNAESVWF